MCPSPQQVDASILLGHCRPPPCSEVLVQSTWHVSFYSCLKASQNPRPTDWTLTFWQQISQRAGPPAIFCFHSQWIISTEVFPACDFLGLPALASALTQIKPTSPMPLWIPKFELLLLSFWDKAYTWTSSSNLRLTCSWHLPLPCHSKKKNSF